MPNCSVVDCDYKKQEKGQYQSFALPKDPDLKAKWVQKLQRDGVTPAKVTENTVICSRHFAEEDFDPATKDSRGRDLKRRKLKDTAVPSLHMQASYEPKIVDARKTRKSIDSLQSERDNLVKEVRELKKKNQFQLEAIEKYRVEVQELKDKLIQKEMKDQKEYDETKTKFSHLNDSIGKIFTDDQKGRLKYPGRKIAAWSDATLLQCITLYLICGKAAYQFMISKGYPFVSIDTLQRHMAKINFNQGILEDIFTLLRFVIEDIPKKHRSFGLVMDEMAVQPKIDFNPSTQSLIGRPTVPIDPVTIERKKKKDPLFDEKKVMATHAMNFLLCGLTKRFKQIIAWFLTSSSYDPKFVVNIIKQIIIKCHYIEIDLTAITIDMSGQNQKI